MNPFELYLQVTVRVTTVAIKCPNQSNVGGKGQFGSHFRVSVHCRSQGRNSDRAGAWKAGAGAETMDKCCLLACSSLLAWTAFLQNSRP